MVLNVKFSDQILSSDALVLALLEGTESSIARLGFVASADHNLLIYKSVLFGVFDYEGARAFTKQFQSEEDDAESGLERCHYIPFSNFKKMHQRRC